MGSPFNDLCTQSQAIMRQVHQFLNEHPEWMCNSNPIGNDNPWITLEFTVKSDYRPRLEPWRSHPSRLAHKDLLTIGDFGFWSNAA
jgi:hypothetical protein